MSYCNCGSISLPDGSVVEPDMSAGFCPDHKAAMVLFLDRVYGIEDQNFLLHLLEVGFLPDLRAAASLDTVGVVFYTGPPSTGNQPDILSWFLSIVPLLHCAPC